MPSENYSRLFEVTTKDLEGLPDARGESVRSMLKVDHGIEVSSVRVILGYHVISSISDSDAKSLVYDLFADPVIEVGSLNARLLDKFPNPPDAAIQVGFKPGVTDNSGHAGLDGLRTLFPEQSDARLATFTTYAIWGIDGRISVSYTHLRDHET